MKWLLVLSVVCWIIGTASFVYMLVHFVVKYW